MGSVSKTCRRSSYDMLELGKFASCKTTSFLKQIQTYESHFVEFVNNFGQLSQFKTALIKLWCVNRTSQSSVLIYICGVMYIVYK